MAREVKDPRLEYTVIIYIHRLRLLSTLVRETPLYGGQQPIQRLIPGQNAETNAYGCSAQSGTSSSTPLQGSRNTVSGKGCKHQSVYTGVL